MTFKKTKKLNLKSELKLKNQELIIYDVTVKHIYFKSLKGCFKQNVPLTKTGSQNSKLSRAGECFLKSFSLL